METVAMTIVSNWLAAIPSSLLVLAWLIAPGALALLAARVRGLAVLAFAPLISLAAIAWVPVVFSFAGVPFTKLSFGLVVLIALVLVAGIASVLQKRWPIVRPISAPTWPVLLGTVLAAPFGILPAMKAIVDPKLPPQTWDGVFHINAVRYILDTSNGSSTAIGAIANVDLNAQFYPGGWHDLVALSYTSDVVVATNSAAVVLGSVLFPFSVAVLLSVLMPTSRFAPIIGAFAAMSFSSLPERPASYGTLWPVMAAYVVLPLVLAALVRFTKRGDGGGLVALVAAIVGLAGLGLVHPSSIFAATAVGWWILLFFLIRARREAISERWQRIVAWLGLIGTPAMLFVIWKSPLFEVVKSWERDPVGTIGRELFGVFADSQLSEQGYGDPVPEWGLLVGLILGLIVAARSRQARWLIPAYATAAYLFVLSSVVHLPGYRLLAPWYFDPVRLGAIVPVVAAPLVGLGIAWVVDMFTANRPAVLRTAAAVVTVGALGLTTHGFNYNQGYWLLKLNYEFKNEDGYNALISPEEVALQHRLKDKLPANARVIGDPRTGAALLYGIADINVLYHHLDGAWGQKGYEVGAYFDKLNMSHHICTTLQSLGIDYYYTDERTYWPENEAKNKYEGLRIGRRHIDRFELVDSGGGAALYRLSLCDQHRD